MNDATHTVWNSTQGAMVPVKLVATREPSYGATVATVEGEDGIYDVLLAHLAPICLGWDDVAQLNAETAWESRGR